MIIILEKKCDAQYVHNINDSMDSLKFISSDTIVYVAEHQIIKFLSNLHFVTMIQL